MCGELYGVRYLILVYLNILATITNPRKKHCRENSNFPSKIHLTMSHEAGNRYITREKEKREKGKKREKRDISRPFKILLSPLKIWLIGNFESL